MTLHRIVVLVVCVASATGCLDLFRLGCLGPGCMGFDPPRNNTLRCEYEENLAIATARDRDFSRTHASLKFLANYCDHVRVVRAKAVYDVEIQKQVKDEKLRRCPALMATLNVSWRHPAFSAQAARVRQACLPRNVDEDIGVRGMDLEEECRQRAARIQQDRARGGTGTSASQCLYFRGQCSPEQAHILCDGV